MKRRRITSVVAQGGLDDERERREGKKRAIQPFVSILATLNDKKTFVPYCQGSMA